jgi:hypothetical protein
MAGMECNGWNGVIYSIPDIIIIIFKNKKIVPLFLMSHPPFKQPQLIKVVSRHPS